MGAVLTPERLKYAGWTVVLAVVATLVIYGFVWFISSMEGARQDARQDRAARINAACGEDTVQTWAYDSGLIRVVCDKSGSTDTYTVTVPFN